MLSGRRNFQAEGKASAKALWLAYLRKGKEAGVDGTAQMTGSMVGDEARVTGEDKGL